MELITGGIIGYACASLVSGETVGEKGLIHFEWFINTFKIHLHHLYILVYFVKS